MRLVTATIICCTLALSAALQPAFGQATTAFSGLPTVKISEGGTERKAEQVPREQAAT